MLWFVCSFVFFNKGALVIHSWRPGLARGRIFFAGQMTAAQILRNQGLAPVAEFTASVLLGTISETVL
jgi:hypothetical protein